MRRLFSASVFLFSGCLWPYSINTAAQLVETYGDWTSLACFEDNTSARVLHHQVGSFENNTVERCLDACAAGGFILGGVEYSRECYCGNAILYDYGTSASCSYPCSGDPTELCGGSNVINIYHYGNVPYTAGPASLVPSYNGWIVTQCWQDDIWPFGYPRLLPHHPGVPVPPEQMTVERCIDGCGASSFTTAGLEWGQECWCGNVTYPPGQSTSGYECSMPCLGNAREYCGGSKRAILYTRIDLG